MIIQKELEAMSSTERLKYAASVVKGKSLFPEKVARGKKLIANIISCPDELRYINRK